MLPSLSESPNGGEAEEGQYVVYIVHIVQYGIVCTVKRNFKGENPCGICNCWFYNSLPQKTFPEGCINGKNFFSKVLFTSQYILLQDKVPCSDEQG